MFLATHCLALMLGFDTAPATPVDLPPVPEQKGTDKPGDPEVIEIDYAQFMLPIMVNPNRRQEIASVRMFVSSDRGKCWELVKEVLPDADGVAFAAPKDGVYWFKVQVVGKNKVLEPADITRGPPDQRVRVETKGKPRQEVLKPGALDQEIQQVRQELKRLQEHLQELEKRRAGQR